MFKRTSIYTFLIILFLCTSIIILAADVGDALQLLSYKVTTSTRPNVADGLIGTASDPTDWSAAYVRMMDIAVDGDLSNETRILTMLIANDSDTLYIAVAAELNSTSVLNRATLYFDQGTRGTLEGSSGSPGEYYVTMQANGNPPTDGHWDGSSWIANSTTKAEGLGARRGSGGLHMFNFEFKMPLNETGDASNGYLNLTAGEEVGILIKVEDNTGQEFFWYQTNAVDTDPSATGGNGKTEWAEIQTIGEGIADRNVVALYAKDIVPTIDGDISGDTDWRYAFDKDIIFSDFDGNTITGSLKIKERVSPDNLLFGITLESLSPASSDHLAIYFDQGTSGGDLNYILNPGTSPSDHASRILGDGTYQDYFFDDPPEVWKSDVTDHGSGAAGSSGGNWEVEFSVPLASGDAAGSDLDIASGDGLGLLLQYYDDSESRSYWWTATINSEKLQIDPDDPVYNALGWGFLQTGGPFIQSIYPEDGDTLSGEYPLAVYALDGSDAVPETGIESIGYEVRKEDAATGTVTTLLSGDLSKIEDDDLAIWTGTLNTRAVTEDASTPLRLVYKVYDGEIDTVYVPIDITINNEGGASGIDDPTFQITSPAPNSVLSGSGISVSFSVDTQSPLTIDTVRVFIDGNLMQTYTPSSTSSYSNTYSWNTSTFPDGEHIIQVWAVNSIGMENFSPSILVTTENTPTISITSPTPSSLVQGTVTVNFTATPVAPSMLSTTQISIDGGSWTAVTSTPPGAGGAGSHSWDTTTLPDGTHTLQVRTADNNGKTGRSDLVSVIVDNRPPVGSLTTTPDEVKDGDTIVFAYNGAEPGLTAVIPLAQIQLLDDQASSELSLTDPESDGIYTANYTIDGANTVADGSKVLTATITDAASNPFYPQVTVTLDNTAPVFVSLVSLDPDTIYSNGETILLLATFDAAGYTVTCDFSTMDIAYVAGAEDVEDNGDGTYTIRYTLSETNTRVTGSYIITATAEDGVGLTGNGNITLLLDNSGPVVSNLLLADADSILNADDNITATITDTDANIQAAEFFIDVIGVAGEGTAMTAVDGSFDSLVENVTVALSIAGLSEGQHTLYVRGQDESGKWGAISSLSFTVDRVAPMITTITVTYPAGQTAARNSQVITISALLYEATTQLDPATILLSSASVDSNSTAGYVMVDDGTSGDAVSGDGIYTAQLTVTSSATGSFNFTIDAADIVPNNSQVTSSVNLDNTAPVFTSLVSLDPDTIYTNGETILLLATFDAAGYMVTCDFSTIDTAYVAGAEAVEDNGDGTYTNRYTISQANSRSNGGYVITATATDGVGLTGSGTISLVLDNSGPVVSNLTLADADSILNADDMIRATVTDNDVLIQAAEYFIDLIGVAGEGIAMDAVDGSFDSLSVVVTDSLDISNLSEGQHTLFVRGQDVTGKWGAVESLIFTVDRVGPFISSVEVIYPDNQTAARNGQWIRISALVYEETTQLDPDSVLLSSASVDSNSSSGYVMVDDGTRGDAVSGDGVYTGQLTVTSVLTDTFDFTIDAADIVPNYSLLTGSVILDNTAPVFVDLVSLDPDTIYTSGETILLLATFDAAGYTVTCDFSAMDTSYVEGAEAVEDNGDGTYTIRYTLSETNSRPSGSYIVTATATDGVALTGSGDITLLLDVSGPVVSNLALDDADDILNSDDVITAIITDTDANIVAAEFFIDVIGVLGEGIPMTASDGTFDALIENVTAVLSIANLSEGQHMVFVRGQNESGKWGSVSSLPFIVDRIAPSIENVLIVYPAGQTAARNGQVITISALITEVTTDLDSASILLRSASVDSNSTAGYQMVDDGTSGDAVAGDGLFTGQLTVTSSSTGTFAFTIDAADIVPNNRKVSGDVLLDNTPPLFTDLVCLDPDTIYTNGETILLLATFDAPDYTVTVDFSSIDASYVQGAEAVEDNGDGTYTIRYTISETNSRPNGSYIITATATDGVGLIDTGTISLYLVNTGPVIISLTLTDPDSILNSDDIIWATVTDLDAAIKSAEYYVDVIGIPGEGTLMSASDGSFDSTTENVTAILPIADLDEGQHTLYVRAQNVSGEWGNAVSLIFIVDRIAPTIENVMLSYPDDQTAAHTGQVITVSALIREATTQLNYSSILLRAALVDAGSTSGYVMVDNGTSGDAVPNDGIFTAQLTVTATSTGTFTFSIDASDIVPNNRQIFGSIIIDNDIPVVSISILPLPDNGELYIADVLIEGVYYDIPDSSGIQSIFMNIKNAENDNVNTSPITIPTNPERAFSRMVSLVEGLNTIQVDVTDGAGNTGSDEIIVTYINPGHTEYVDGSGGIITAPDGTTIVIPSGALLSGETITISMVNTEGLPKPLDNIRLLAPAHRFGPEGLVFHEPVIITLAYNESDLDIDQDWIMDFDENRLDVYLLDGSHWVKTEADARDPVLNTITFTTNHFSIYALGNDDATHEFTVYWTHNPFNPDDGTTVVIELSQSGEITLKIYDLSGNRVRTIADAEPVTGTTHRRWDGLNDFDRFVGSGIYIYVFEYKDDKGNRSVIKKPIGVVK